METPETIRTSLQAGEWVTFLNFKDAYFHIPIHSPGSTCAFTSRVNHTSSKHCPLVCPQQPWSSHWQPTVGFTEGYMDPPVSRRLVGESQFPPYLSPAYTDFSSSLPRARLAGEQEEIRTVSKTGFQLRRLPVRPERVQGQTHTRAHIQPDPAQKSVKPEPICLDCHSNQGAGLLWGSGNINWGTSKRINQIRLRQSGPSLQSGASVIRWTSVHHLWMP